MRGEIEGRDGMDFISVSSIERRVGAWHAIVIAIVMQ
tara:strand:- start:1049 stop:1159 length:111 start_codon:yes stop_codon:yes gene_type:complete